MVDEKLRNGIINIIHDGAAVPVNVKDDVEWTVSRQGEPGKLKFTIVDPPSTISEGDPVLFYWNGQGVFYGFLFSRTTDKVGQWECTAYDQLRYLKNKDTIVFENEWAVDCITKICSVFGVAYGYLTGSTYRFTKVEENTSGLDMIGDLCDQMLIERGRMYVLYDDFGRVTFKDIEKEMQVNHVIDENVGEDFDYTISIDDRTYNKVKVVSDEEYVSLKVDDKIKEWGLLELYQKVSTKPTEQLALDLLNVYCRPSKKLRIKNANGNINVRGGSWFPVVLDLGIEKIQAALIVDSVTHHFKADEYTMDVTLIGGRGFVA